MNLEDLRTTLICVFSFMGFLRYSEVSILRMSDIVIHDSNMAIFIEKRKTDIYRNGNWLYLAKLKSKLCPITLLRRYMKLAKICKHSNDYIFRRLCKRGNSFRLREKDMHISLFVFFFLSGFSFTNIHDSRDSRGRGRVSI